MNTIKLAKGDLHCHLIGSLNPQDIRSLAKKNHVDATRFEPLENFIEFHSQDYWTFVRNLLSTPDTLSKGLEIFLEKEAADGVIYAEPIINLGKILLSGINIQEMIEKLEETIYNCRKRLKIDTKIRVGVNREDGHQGITNICKFLTTNKSAIFAGLDLNGNEKKYPNVVFSTELQKIKAIGMNATIHAGEYSFLDKSALTTISFKPNRIGHGIALANHPEIFDFLRENKIIIEVCLSSNLLTKAVSSLIEHPVSIFEASQVPYVLATDNPAITLSPLSHEYELLSSLGVTNERLSQIASLSLSPLNQHQKAYS